jgi:hypothetical protein
MELLQTTWKEEKEARFIHRFHKYQLLETLTGTTDFNPFPTRRVNPEKLGFNDAIRLAEEVGRQLNLGNKPAALLGRTLEETYGV